MVPSVLVVTTTVHDVEGVPSPDVASLQVPPPAVPAVELLRRTPHAAVLTRRPTGTHPTVQAVPTALLLAARPIGRPTDRQGAAPWPLPLLHASPRQVTILLEDLTGLPAEAQALQEAAVGATASPVVATLTVAT